MKMTPTLPGFPFSPVIYVPGGDFGILKPQEKGRNVLFQYSPGYCISSICTFYDFPCSVCQVQGQEHPPFVVCVDFSNRSNCSTVSEHRGHDSLSPLSSLHLCKFNNSCQLL